MSKQLGIVNFFISEGGWWVAFNILMFSGWDGELFFKFLKFSDGCGWVGKNLYFFADVINEQPLDRGLVLQLNRLGNLKNKCYAMRYWEGDTTD